MKKFIAMLTVLLVYSLCIYPLSINATAAEADEGELEYAYGIVEEISLKEIVLSEYNYDTGEELEVSYAITSDTKFVNVEKLEDISAGDNVEIDFIIKNGTNTAKIISVEEWLEEEPEY